MAVLRIALAVVVPLAVAWLLFVIVLAVVRPRGFDLRAARRFVPDLARLMKDLAADRSLPKGVRRRLGALVVYLALPFDLVPDFVPVLGYADDIIVIALVLRSVVRHAGPDVVQRHWHGSPEGLALVSALAGLR